MPRFIRPLASGSLLALALFAAQPACKSVQDFLAGDPPEPSVSATALAKAPPVEPPDPDDAYFETEGKKGYYGTLYRVRAGKITAIETSNCGSRDEIHIEPSGEAWLGCCRVEGTRATAVDCGQHENPSWYGFRTGADKAMWMKSAHPHALHKWNGKGWETIPMVEGVEPSPYWTVDAQGRPWFTTNDAVYVRDGGAWTSIPLTKKEYGWHVIASDNGVVMVQNSIEPWVEVQDKKLGPKSAGVSDYQAVTRPGGGFITHDRHTLRLTDAKGKVERTIDLKKGGVAESNQWLHGHEVAVDGRGRVWIATEFGMVVVQPDGKMEQWEPGRVTGYDDTARIKQVAVGGRGPELPVLRPKARGEVTGRLPISKRTRVELCTGNVGWSRGGGPVEFFGDTPCANNEFRHVATSDAEGRFTAKDVAPYGMWLIWQIDGSKWATRDVDCCWDVSPTKPVDLGAVK